MDETTSNNGNAEATKSNSKRRNSKLKPLPPPIRDRTRAAMIRLEPRNLVKHGLIPEVSWLTYCNRQDRLEVQLIDQGTRYVVEGGEVRDFKTYRDVSKQHFADELDSEQLKDVWFISDLQGATGQSLREIEARLDGLSGSRLEDGLFGDEASSAASQDAGTRRSSEAQGQPLTSKFKGSDMVELPCQKATSSRFRNIQGKKYRRRSKVLEVVQTPETKYVHRSLFLFELENPLRKRIICGIESPWWDRCVLSVIFLNTFFLAMYDPFDTPAWRECEHGITDPYGYCSWNNETWRLAPAAGSMLLSGKSWPPFHRDFLDFSSKIFSLFFILEFLAKTIALGVFVGRNTYLRDAWNWLDLLVVIIGCLDFMPSSKGNSTSNLSALRSLRLLRPLRAINRLEELKFFVVLVFKAIPMLMNVLLICSVLFLLFGILGLDLYQGSINLFQRSRPVCSRLACPAGVLRGRCFDVETGAPGGDVCSKGRIADPGEYFWVRKGMDVTSPSHVGGMFLCPTGQECLLLGQNLGRGLIHFDDIGHSLLAIFQIITLEGWADICYALQDAVGFWNFIYFLALICAGSFFAVQLFLVVISNQYAFLQVVREKNTQAEASKSGNVETKRPTIVRSGSLSNVLVLDTKKLDGFARWKFVMKTFVKSEMFVNFILLVIFCNTISMALDGLCEFERQSWCAPMKASMEIANIVFTLIFALEMVLKVTLLGPQRYFGVATNLFDFIIVVLSFIEVFSGGFADVYKCYTTAPTEADIDVSLYLPTSVSPAFLSDEDMQTLRFDKVFRTAEGDLKINPWFYYTCGSGGFVSLLRALRLFRLVKLLSAFPELQKQVLILGEVVKSVFALIILMAFFLILFMILGMNLFGGLITMEWDATELQKGQEVFVTFVNDTNGGIPRHGKIYQYNSSGTLAPWKVKIEFADVEPSVNHSVGGLLDREGMVWCSTLDETSGALPFISSIVPRFHYNNLGQAFLTSFQVLTICNWNDDLYDTAASAGASSAVFFCLIVIIGNWVVFNLFVAILISKFMDSKAENLKKNMSEMEKAFQEVFVGLEDDDLVKFVEKVFTSLDVDSSGVIDIYELRNALGKLGMHLDISSVRDLLREFDNDASGGISFKEFLSLIKSQLDKIANKDTRDARAKVRDSARGSFRAGDLEFLECVTETRPNLPEEAHGSVEGLRRVIDDPWFDRFILICIILSTITLSLDNKYIGEGSRMGRFLYGTEIFLNIIFTLEMICKILAFSFRSYFSSSWNRLDMFIVVTSDLDMILTFVNVEQSLSLFKSLRAFRPLARIHGLRLLLEAMILAVAPVINTGAIAIATCLLLGILGLQLLGLQLGYCSDGSVWSKLQCEGIDSGGSPRKWESYVMNFDNLGHGVLTQLMIASQDDWTSHMLAGLDSTGKVTGPLQNTSMTLVIFYLISFLVTSSVIVNMFVAVCVDCYNTTVVADGEHKEEEVPICVPIVKDNPSKTMALSLISSLPFEMLMNILTVTQICCMMLTSWKQSDVQDKLNLYSNFFFTFLFGAECIVKLAGLSPRRYYRGWENRLDYFIVVSSFVSSSVEAVGNLLNPALLRSVRLIRLVRVLRILRILRSVDGPQEIISAIAGSASSILNLLVLMCVLFFIYAVIGVDIFGGLCVDGDQLAPGLRAVRCLLTSEDRLLDRHAHFQGMGMALLTLLRTATGDAWGEIIGNLALTPPRREPVPADSWLEVTRALSPLTANVTALSSSSSSLLPRQGLALLAVHARSGIRRVEEDEVEAVRILAMGPDHHGIAMAVAKFALRRWNASVEGQEDSADWPLPSSEAAMWVQLARLVLPGCLTGGEAKNLSESGLADCSIPGRFHSSGPLECSSTCGLPLLWCSVFLYSFFGLSAYVMLQLVIGVLMDQLSARQTEDKLAGARTLPCTEKLTRMAFQRMYR
eukprot:431203-Hanusia_phi.AAC.4